jgi:flagellar basal body rod protein FlgC
VTSPRYCAGMSSLTSIGAAGMQAASARLQGVANRVARMGVSRPDGAAPETDLAGAMVDAMLASTDFKAATKIVEIGRKMDQATFDMIA